jgi:hypothetical protein
VTEPGALHAPTDAALAEGRRLVADLDRSQWALGDLALREIGPVPVRGAHDPNRAALHAFAEAIGLAPARLAEYRSVAASWTPDERIEGAAWSLHRGLAARDDRADVLSAYLAECHDAATPPTRTGLRTWLTRREPVEPPPRTITLPATVDGVVAALREAVEEDHRLERLLFAQRREADDLLCGWVTEHLGDVDPADPEAVVAWVRADVTNAAECLATMAKRTHWPWDESWEPPRPGRTLDEQAADGWSIAYGRWRQRQEDLIETDPWEDR